MVAIGRAVAHCVHLATTRRPTALLQHSKMSIDLNASVLGLADSLCREALDERHLFDARAPDHHPEGYDLTIC
jgi:hypothetical protein